MTSEERLKDLQIKRQVVSDELIELAKAKQGYQRKIDNINHKCKDKVSVIKSLSLEIGKLKGAYENGNASGKVSDHAIVRYLERYKGIDILAVVNEILEHPDRKYTGDVVTTIFANETPAPERSMIKIAKLSQKRRERKDEQWKTSNSLPTK